MICDQVASVHLKLLHTVVTVYTHQLPKVFTFCELASSVVKEGL